MVIADEAHVIKNNLSQVSQAFMTIRTKRRVALTGSPLQNNLLEYWTMVEWTKPKFLGNSYIILWTCLIILIIIISLLYPNIDNN